MNFAFTFIPRGVAQAEHLVADSSRFAGVALVLADRTSSAVGSASFCDLRQQGRSLLQKSISIAKQLSTVGGRKQLSLLDMFVSLPWFDYLHFFLRDLVRLLPPCLPLNLRPPPPHPRLQCPLTTPCSSSMTILVWCRIFCQAVNWHLTPPRLQTLNLYHHQHHHRLTPRHRQLLPCLRLCRSVLQ